MKKSKQFHSATIPDSRLLKGILGLRGIAAFAIVLFHLCHLTGISVPEGFHFIERDFGTGVQLFFVLSAFSLMYSTEHTMHRPDWAREYLIKRFFRIAPLFYVMLAYMLFTLVRHSVISDSALPNLSAVFLNIFFIFGFFPNPEIGFVWAGWSVGVEMIFYALFPLLLMIIKTKREALVLLLISVLIGYASGTELHNLYLSVSPTSKRDWSGFAFLPYLIFFSMGIYAYRFEQTQIKSGSTLHNLIPLVGVLAIGVLLFAAQSHIDLGQFSHSIRALGFGALCVWQSTKPSIWCANKFFEYLGERSFSIYLLHPLIIYKINSYIVHLYSELEPYIGAYAFFVCALVIMGEVLVMAEITYRVIEVPGIKLGRKVIGTMRGTAPQIKHKPDCSHAL